MDSIEYDYEPKTNSKYLRMRSKGDSIKIRIVSKAVRWEEEMPVKNETGDTIGTKKKENFAWVVIDRADGEAKAFRAGVSIFLKIKELAQNDDWGDPTGYDITITRTETNPANYYSVVASPNKSKLTKDEIAKAAEIDLNEMFGKKLSTNITTKDVEEVGL